MSMPRSAEKPAAANPLDLMEELVAANEWRYDRTNEEEMVVEFAGQFCEYRLFFVWQADLSALYFSCLFDLKVPAAKKAVFAELLALINERLWLGHFDLSPEEMAPMFRYTFTLRGTGGVTAEQLEDAIETALNESERFYPAFQFVLWGGRKPEEALAAAILDPVGEA